MAIQQLVSRKTRRRQQGPDSSTSFSTHTLESTHSKPNRGSSSHNYRNSNSGGTYSSLPTSPDVEPSDSDLTSLFKEFTNDTPFNFDDSPSCNETAPYEHTPSAFHDVPSYSPQIWSTADNRLGLPSHVWDDVVCGATSSEDFLRVPVINDRKTGKQIE